VKSLAGTLQVAVSGAGKVSTRRKSIPSIYYFGAKKGKFDVKKYRAIEAEQAHIAKGAKAGANDELQIDVSAGPGGASAQVGVKKPKPNEGGIWVILVIHIREEYGDDATEPATNDRGYVACENCDNDSDTFVPMPEAKDDSPEILNVEQLPDPHAPSPAPAKDAPKNDVPAADGTDGVTGGTGSMGQAADVDVDASAPSSGGTNTGGTNENATTGSNTSGDDASGNTGAQEPAPAPAPDPAPAPAPDPAPAPAPDPAPAPAPDPAPSPAPETEPAPQPPPPPAPVQNPKSKTSGRQI
jgi:hypothetical protein